MRVLFKTFQITALCFGLLCSARAADETLCQKSFIESLRIIDVPDLSALDVCVLPEIPATLQTTITQIGELNRLIAKTLELETTQLFASGLKLSIKAFPSGAMNSVSGQMGVFPDWRGGEIEPSIYIHEIGHVLLYLNRIPYLTALSRNTAFKESFPDLLARSAFNQPTLNFHFLNAPACAVVRPPRVNFSYSYRDFFGYYDAKAFVDCCRSTVPDLYGPQFKALCESRESSLEKLSTLSDAPGVSSDCVDSGPIPRGSFSPKSCSGHVFSNPLDNFLLQMESLTQTPRLKIILEAAKKQNDKGDYVCTEVSTGKVKRPTGSGIQSFREILLLVRDGLRDDQKLIFNELWAKHNFEFMAELDDREVNRMLQMRLGHFENICVGGVSESCDYVCEHERP